MKWRFLAADVMTRREITQVFRQRREFENFQKTFPGKTWKSGNLEMLPVGCFNMVLLCSNFWSWHWDETGCHHLSLFLNLRTYLLLFLFDLFGKTQAWPYTTQSSQRCNWGGNYFQRFALRSLYAVCQFGLIHNDRFFKYSPLVGVTIMKTSEKETTSFVEQAHLSC